MRARTPTVTSKDGTKIAYDKVGSGPVVVLVLGALNSRKSGAKLAKLLASGRNGDAVALFVRSVGVSDKQVQAMKRITMWRGLERLAPTLAYDSDILGEGHSLPTALLAGITTPTLVMHGGAGTPAMRDTAQAISEAIPKAQLRTLAGQTHGVSPKVLVPVLAEFFA